MELETICNFIQALQPPFSEKLHELEQDARKRNIPIISHETASLLGVLFTMNPPKNILEIGTAIGFSACFMSQYLQPGGKITTIDRFPVMLQEARPNIDALGLNEVIEIREGDAADIVPTLTGPYDVVFLDGAKGQYPSFLQNCLPLLSVGGLLIADDVLQEGELAKSRFDVPRRQRTIHKRMRSFLWDISHMDCLQSAIVPVGGGLAISVKTKEQERICL